MDATKNGCASDGLPMFTDLDGAVRRAEHDFENVTRIKETLDEIERLAPKLVVAHKRWIKRAIERLVERSPRTTAKQIRTFQIEQIVMGAFYFRVLTRAMNNRANVAVGLS